MWVHEVHAKLPDGAVLGKGIGHSLQRVAVWGFTSELSCTVKLAENPVLPQRADHCLKIPIVEVVGPDVQNLQRAVASQRVGKHLRLLPAMQTTLCHDELLQVLVPGQSLEKFGHHTGLVQGSREASVTQVHLFQAGVVQLDAVDHPHQPGADAFARWLQRAHVSGIDDLANFVPPLLLGRCER